MTSVELRTLASRIGLAANSYKRKDLEKAMSLATLKQLREHAILCLKKKYSRQFDKFSEETSHRVVKSTDISLLSVHKRTSNHHNGTQNIKDIINNLFMKKDFHENSGEYCVKVTCMNYLYFFSI